MGRIDKRNRLGEPPFQYSVTKSGVVCIDYENRQVKVLKGKDADRFLEKVKTAESEKERQLVMAKITGNFKRGTERL
ncbi:hypothetical protein AAEO50_04540 [Rossellomorea oryzaecorticis]|uniref:Uncharacterized protein n=1 Tax=Rossellomorea oryzaecorticis TaxID=1396505 RepID=A0ABU9K715_9BACI